MNKRKINKVTEIREYIYDFRQMRNEKIVSFRSICNLGKYYFNEVIKAFPNENIELIKFVISTFGNEENLLSKDDYYYKLINILDITADNLPRKNYFSAINELKKIKKSYDYFNTKIANKISILNNLKHNIKTKISNIISILNSFTLCNSNFKCYHEKLSVLEKEDRNITNQLNCMEYLKKYTNDKILSFCNINDINEIRLKAIDIAIEVSIYNRKISNYFKYENEMLLVSKYNINHIMDIEFYIKTECPRIILRERYRKNELKLKEVALSEFMNKICCENDNLPKIKYLKDNKKNDMNLYLEQIEKMLDSYYIIDKNLEIINKSILLFERKEILCKAIELYKNGEYLLCNNILSVQIEGIFNDLLNKGDYFYKIGNFENKKFNGMHDKVKNCVNDKYYYEFEITAYFSCIFSSNVRNIIVHGDYLEENKIRQNVLSVELLLDFFMLSKTIVLNNEIEFMGYCLSTYFEKSLLYRDNDSDKNVYDILLNDILGIRSYLYNDMIKNLGELQMLFWVFNSYYNDLFNKIYDEKILRRLKLIILSRGFWNFLYDKLQNDIFIDKSRLLNSLNSIPKKEMDNVTKILVEKIRKLCKG